MCSFYPLSKLSCGVNLIAGYSHLTTQTYKQESARRERCNRTFGSRKRSSPRIYNIAHPHIIMSSSSSLVECIV